jgi:hypothetical protein
MLINEPMYERDWSQTCTNAMSTDQMPTTEGLLRIMQSIPKRTGRDVIVVDEATHRLAKKHFVCAERPAEMTGGFPMSLYGLPYEVYPTRCEALDRAEQLKAEFGRNVCCVTQPEVE